jgi:hypothetical protein
LPGQFDRVGGQSAGVEPTLKAKSNGIDTHLRWAFETIQVALALVDAMMDVESLL